MVHRPEERRAAAPDEGTCDASPVRIVDGNGRASSERAWKH
jgi:hypothetical protein